VGAPPTVFGAFPAFEDTDPVPVLIQKLQKFSKEVDQTNPNDSLTPEQVGELRKAMIKISTTNEVLEDRNIPANVRKLDKARQTRAYHIVAWFTPKPCESTGAVWPLPSFYQ
jgi:hypothetical protein